MICTRPVPYIICTTMRGCIVKCLVCIHHTVCEKFNKTKFKKIKTTEKVVKRRYTWHNIRKISDGKLQIARYARHPQLGITSQAIPTAKPPPIANESWMFKRTKTLFNTLKQRIRDRICHGRCLIQKKKTIFFNSTNTKLWTL